MHSCKTLDLHPRGTETRRQREAFDRVRRAERHYTVQLRKVARAVGMIVAGFQDVPDQAEAIRLITEALGLYSETIRPWSKAVAASMLVDVSRRDDTAWRAITASMGSAVRLELNSAPTGAVYHQKMAEQVKLITSIPLDAARRVHYLAAEALADSTRAKAISEEIYARSGEVSKSKADLIARTEVGRSAAAFTQARAEHIDSPGYIWRTAGDNDVRNIDRNPVGSHRLLNGKFIPWDKPPVASTNGQRAHAGAIYNCRCYPEPIIPARFL
jgi:SPP1 gp7 family putative phage head morphogenesis protein